MKPVTFKKQNVVFAEDQPEYIPLPALRSPDGCVTTCWKLSFLERIHILFTGRLWLQCLTFGSPLQPQKPSIGNPVILEDLILEKSS